MCNPFAAIIQQFRHAVIDPSHPSAAEAIGGAPRLPRAARPDRPDRGGGLHLLRPQGAPDRGGALIGGLDWQERISRETNAAIRIEHETALFDGRGSAIRAAPLWCDLGCGNGIAAAEAAGGPFAGRAVLVDLAEDALRQAEREFEAESVTTHGGRSGSEEDLGRVRDALLEGDPEGGCITCFEVVEHLANFVPLIELLVGLAEKHGFTAATQRPERCLLVDREPVPPRRCGARAPSRSCDGLLPEDHVVAHQLALQGSLTRVDGADRGAPCVELEASAGAVPTHFLVALRPGRSGCSPERRGVAQADLVEQRRWERQRESDLAYLKSLEAELRDSRTYIHELEGQPRLAAVGHRRRRD